MEYEKPAYYSIITAEVRYNKNLSASEKLFYSEITALSCSNGYCYASNNYFTNLFEVNERTIRNWIANLKKEKLIIVKTIDNQRRIFLNNSINIIKNLNTRKKQKKAIEHKPGKYELENSKKDIMQGMDIL